MKEVVSAVFCFFVFDLEMLSVFQRQTENNERKKFFLLCMFYKVCIFPVFFLFSVLFINQVYSASSDDKILNDRISEFVKLDSKTDFENPNCYIQGIRKNNILQKLQTSLIRLTNHQKYPDLEVDLIGAIHFADMEYYQAISSLLQNYDIVLYEMVYLNKSQQPVKKSKFLSSKAILEELFSSNINIVLCGKIQEDQNTNWPLYLLGRIQEWIGKNLKLASQTDCIDYQKENMCHADIDAETLIRRYLDNGDLDDLIMRVVLAGFLDKNTSSSVSGIGILFSRNRLLSLKRTVAESLLLTFTDDIANSRENVIISERNKIALKYFADTLKTPAKKIAIFYGCAHLEDFVTRLKNDFDLDPVKLKWITAWDLTLK